MKNSIHFPKENTYKFNGNFAVNGAVILERNAQSDDQDALFDYLSNERKKHKGAWAISIWDKSGSLVVHLADGNPTA